MKAQTLNLVPEILSGPLYETKFSKPPRTITNLSLQVSSDIKNLLEKMTKEYFEYADIPDMPVRIDLGISEDGKLIPFEINTGFVDQFGSGLNILECLGQSEEFEKSLENLAKNRKYSKIVISCPEYTKEVELMMEYLKQKGKNIEIISEQEALKSDEKIFCYGYPTENMKGNSNIVPGGIGLERESKRDFYEFLDDRMKKEGDQNKYFKNLKRYNQSKQPYNKLPKDKQLIFKKDGPKTKGDRNTVDFAKAKPGNQNENEYLYKFGFKIAQELLNPMIFNNGIEIIEKNDKGELKIKNIEKTTAEIRALLLPNEDGFFDFIVAYLLLGGLPENRGLVNDSCPQGAVIFD